MEEQELSFIGRLRELNSRAGGYARIRIRHELHSSDDLRGRHLVRFAFTLDFLKVYYVFNAPVVTIVSRSNRLMALVRIFYAPTRRVVRNILR